MFNKNNCFAYDGENDCCDALLECDCSESCAFYKTKDQAAVDKQKANERLATLPSLQQQQIADAYYQGKKVWLDKEGGRDDG